ncbi:MAG: MFS transporter, partial [Antricoccus sp.]
PPASSQRSLWYHRDFRWLWGGDTASQFCAALGVLAIPYLAVTTLNATKFEMGLLGTLTTIGFLVIGLPSGALIDRWNKRSVMILADFSRAVLLITIPLAWWLNWLTFIQLAAVATVVGMLQVFFDVAYQSYLPTLVKRDQVVEGNAKLQASQSVSQSAGPALAGLIIKVVGAAAAVGVNAVGYFISALCLLRIKHREEPHDRADRKPIVSEIREGLSFVVRHPLLSRMLACTAILNFFSELTWVLLIYYQVNVLHFSAVTIGLVNAVGAAGGLVGALVATRISKAIGEGPSILLGATIACLAFVCIPLSAYVAPVATFLIGMPITMAGVVAYNIATVSFRQRLCPPKLLGRMNASCRFIVWGTMPLGAFAGGWLGSQIGTLPTLWVGFAGGFLGLLPIYFSNLWKLRTLSVDDEEPAAPEPTASRTGPDGADQPISAAETD